MRRRVSCAVLARTALEVCGHFQPQADWRHSSSGGWLTLGRQQIIRFSRPLQFHTIDNDELLVRFQIVDEASQVLILTLNRHADSDTGINALPLRIGRSRSRRTSLRV